MAYLSTKSTIAEYSEMTANSLDSDNQLFFSTFRDFCLYLCGGDFTAFDDYNTLANEMMNDDLKKGISIC